MLALVLGWVVKAFGSGILGSILGAVTSVLNKNTDLKITQVTTAGQVDVASLQASVAIAHEQESLAALRWGWWGTRYMMMAAALPAIWHMSLVFLDTCPMLPWPSLAPLALFAPHEIGSWHVAALPGLYQGLELQVIGVVVGIMTAQTVGGGLVGALTKK